MSPRMLLAFLLLSSCGGPPAASTPAARGAEPTGEYAALLKAEDRSEQDRALDPGRRPAELLAFAGVRSGMHVAELGAGTGYTSELLARAVGRDGRVYAQNSRFILEKFAEKPWSDRLATPAMASVVRVDREWDDPLPPSVRELDAVLVVLVYHDLFWLKADRAKMNLAVLRALKPGGLYVIVDHSGRAGTGATEVSTLHRIEEKIVKDEISAAGFRLVKEGSFLRNPADTRDWNDSPMAAKERRGTSDRFVLAFEKPL